MNKQEFESIPNHLPIDWEAEKQKCIESPYYFFTNYCTTNGEKCTTPLSEEEFNKQAKQIVPENLKEFVENTREYMKISQPDLYVKASKELYGEPIVSMVMYSGPTFPSLETTIDDFISFKFFLNRYKGQIEVTHQKILKADKSELFNSTEAGLIDIVAGRYFSISRPSGTMTVEFGRPSDWTFSQTDFTLKATRRNGGELIVTMQRK